MTYSKLARRNWLKAVSMALLGTGFCWGADAKNNTFSGRATVLQANVAGLQPVVLSDTGPLPQQGGAQQASLLTASVPGLLGAEVLHASTVGQGNSSRSEASVAQVNLMVASNTITADFLMARAEASCANGTPSVSGSSEVVGLTINGQSISVSTAPNQQVNLPVGYVIINEQTGSSSGDFGEMTVNALHVVIPGIADVIISSASADIECAAAEPCAGDFVTSGGWITGTPSGAKANFGVAGGIKQGSLWGHLTYIDHGNGMHVVATSVTAYAVDSSDSTCRDISYAVTINGAPGTANVIACDKGQPGHFDILDITLSNGYQAGGTLGGGNIKLHPCK